MIVTNIVNDLDRELRAPSATPVKAIIGAAVRGPADLVLHENERGTLVEVLAARLTPEDGTARPAWVKSLLMKAMLYAQLAGEDYTGSAQTVASTLVTKTEALGVLPDGQRAVLRLVCALRDPGRVSQTALPFLASLAKRLESGGDE
jgi:hypothetical protein